MITGIRIKNLRSHLDSDFKFSNGTNALVGILGSGKSTVMNALCLGLFGTFPDLQGKKLKLDDIIMNKPYVKDTAEVVVDFTVDEKNYTVMRVIERGKGTTYSEIREGDKLLDAPNSQRVTEIVEKILRVNYELFSKAIYSEQNALDYFLTIPRGERMRRIDNLLTIDKFEKARSSAVSARNKLIERKLGKQSIIDQTNVEEVKKNIGDIEYSLNGLNKSRTKISSDLENLTKERTEIENRLEKLEKLDKNLISLKQEEKSLETAIEENSKVVEDIKRLLRGKKPEEIKTRMKDLSEKLKKLDAELIKKRNEYERLTKLISESKTRIDFLEKDKIEKLEEEVSDKLKIQKKLDKVKEKYGERPVETFKQEQKELEKIDRELTSVTTKLSETKNILKGIYDLKDQCPVCLSKLTATKKRKVIEQQKKKVNEIDKQLRVLRKNKKTKLTKIEELESIVDKFKEFLTEVRGLDKLQDQLEELRKTHDDLIKRTKINEKEFKEMRDEITQFQENIDKERNDKKNLEFVVSRLSEFEKMKSRLSNFKIKEENVKRKISDTVKKIGDYDLNKIRRELTQIISETSELEERVKSLGNLITEKKNRKKEHEEKLKQIDFQKKDVSKLEKIIKDLRIFEKALERTQVQLRTEFVDAVNYTMDKIWPGIYPYEDFMSIGLNIEGGDYILQLKDRIGRWISVEGIASGGERSLASLALRIAFSLVLAPNIRMLILDEPTANLDSRSITELATTLRERVNEFIDQTFLITHERELENAVTGNAYRIERDKSVDGATKVSAM